MLTITMGTQASGSTWIFNVVRALLEESGRSFHSGTTDDGLTALDQMPLSVECSVIKSHSLDQRLIRLAQLASARVIVSTRNPRDSVVSQGNRFGASLQCAVSDLSKAYATLAVMPADLPQLRFAYEEGFTGRVDAITRIADFLDLPVSQGQAADILEALSPEAVKAQIDARLAEYPVGEDPGQDPVTMWHPRHVGDGRIGKWRDHLDGATEQAIGRCLDPLAHDDAWQRQTVHWSAGLFSYHHAEGAGDEAGVELTCGGEGGFLVYGPYMFLPPGYWRVRMHVEALNRWRDVHVEGDVYLAHVSDDPVVSRRATLRRGLTERLEMVFRHADHFQKIEVRLHAVAGSRGRLRFAGCELDWLGPVEE